MIHLVMASDDNFIMHLAVAATSCIVNTSEPVTLWALLNNVSEENKRKLEKTIGSLNKNTVLRVIDLNPENLEGMRTTHNITATMYARFFIPDLLPAELGKALYLDTDIIARHDISELWNTDISDYPIAAVEDPYIKKYYARFNIPVGTPLFNSGVMLMNLRMWRKTNLGKRCFDYCRKTANVDQIGLNKIICGNWRPLDIKWNVLNGYFSLSYYKIPDTKKVKCPRAEMKDPYIFHATGRVKPSEYRYVYSFAEDYYGYLKMTEWRDYTPSDITTANKIRKALFRIKMRIIEFIKK
ncbi:MAG: glycosyltransferase family 8 protein [Abditibacteriota bacterium]|nr:glycosyltransferase family 8 protein [Abditibacteriota bacterium]